jgi:hypothetical protein
VPSPPSPLSKCSTLLLMNSIPPRGPQKIKLSLKGTECQLGATSAAAQSFTIVMFAQSSWFGANFVRDGTIGAGDVATIFGACLIATSNLQMCIPQFITLAKGKFAIVGSFSLIQGLARQALPRAASYPSAKSFLIAKPATANSPSPPYHSATFSPHSPHPLLHFVLSPRSRTDLHRLFRLRQIHHLELYHADSGTALLDDTGLRYVY